MTMSLSTSTGTGPCSARRARRQSVDGHDFNGRPPATYRERRSTGESPWRSGAGGGRLTICALQQARGAEWANGDDADVGGEGARARAERGGGRRREGGGGAGAGARGEGAGGGAARGRAGDRADRGSGARGRQARQPGAGRDRTD